MDLVIIYLVLGIIFVISLLLFYLLNGKVKKFIFGIVSCICVIVFGVISFNPLLDNINYGIDLQGGFEILYQISPLVDGEDLSSDMVYNTYKALLKRIDVLGVSEPEITIEGEDRIRVKLAGVTNKEEAREILSSTANLSFRDVNNRLLMTSDVLGGSAKVGSDDSGRPAISLNISDTDTFYDKTLEVSKMYNNKIVIWLDFEEGVDKYVEGSTDCNTLTPNSNGSICLSAATVSKGFASDVIITGNFSNSEAKSLVELINSGALPTKLNEISSRTVEATFGENSLNKTLFASVIGISIVVLIMLFVYKFSGFIASLGIVLYTVLSFLVFYLIDGVLTLPGIAAMLLGIGMAVDANVISFERIRERLKMGESLNDAFEIGNKNSLTSIIDANITTMIVAIILFIFGESSVKGFATMLIINIVVTILVMVIIVKFIIKLFVNTKFFNDKLYMFIGVKKKDIEKSREVKIPYGKLDFIRNGKYFVCFSVLVIIVGIVISFVTGTNLGVDFTGGTSITVNVIDSGVISNIKSEFKDMEYNVKKVDVSSFDVTFTIDEVLDKDEIKELSNVLESKYETNTDIYTVSKVVKQELTKNAIYSFVLACIGIVIYVSIRFKFNYAISALVALAHDVIMVILFFCIFKIEITSIFIAAILTIIGYSINDTIVTFDMIRENYRVKFKNNIKSKDKFMELVNMSVRRTLYRSILTTVTTIFPVICLMVFGAREIVNFNIALLVGFISGVYSSIYISNQLWFILEYKRVNKEPKENKKDDELNELEIKGINC